MCPACGQMRLSATIEFPKPITDCTRPSNIMDGIVAKRNTHATSCGKLANIAGALLTDGGMRMTGAGVWSAIGMTNTADHIDQR